MAGFEEHNEAAFLENVQFLREGGLSDEAIARRLGVSIKTLEKREERRKHGKRVTVPRADRPNIRG